MKWWDIKTPALVYDRHMVNKFFNNLVTRGATINGRAILLVYNSECPELSYILIEEL